jgi:predicted alpha/beta-fold hydrolase
MSAAKDFEPQPFRARPPWWGADLQTVRNAIAGEPQPLHGERLWFDTDDGSGDRLAALWHRPDQAGAQMAAPAIFLIHGLSGSEDSRYMPVAADYFLARGHQVVRFNMRGAGPSRPHCRWQYHAGRSEDIRAAIAGLPDQLTRNGIVIVGFSLGGNVALKFAGELAGEQPVAAIVSISAPIDLAATSRNMLRWRNRLYNRHLLRDFQREVLADGSQYSERERQAVLKARNFVELDDWFVAPRNGFADAWDYYDKAMSLPYLAEIRVPTLLVHARDDPLVPVAPYLHFPWQDNRRLTPLLPKRGGHVGFHGRDGVPWYLPVSARFMAQKVSS